jgi:cellulose synthase/poly-beta-1,6-N-acetylglucosamine synthase-like glycosyltransferase
LVSVLIAARNEAHHLPKLLRALQHQSYPRDLCEFIVIDDRSNDETPQLLNEWQHRLPLRAIRIDCVPDGVNPKKFALAAAIQQARGTVLVTTDADCIPSPLWLESLADAFEEKVGAVVGVSPWYVKGKLWGSIIAYESLATMAVALAGVGQGRPFLAVGRNFAFRRELYQRVAGYASDIHIFSGDDDLLLQKINKLKEYRVVAVFTPESQSPSCGAESLWAFIRQKRRHISAGQAYPWRQKIGYALYHASNAGLWLCPLFFGFWGWAFLLAKLLMDAIICQRVGRMCRLQIAWPAFFPWQALFLFTHIFVGPTAFFGRIRWKS